MLLHTGQAIDADAILVADAEAEYQQHMDGVVYAKSTRKNYRLRQSHHTAWAESNGVSDLLTRANTEAYVLARHAEFVAKNKTVMGIYEWNNMFTALHHKYKGQLAAARLGLAKATTPEEREHYDATIRVLHDPTATSTVWLPRPNMEICWFFNYLLVNQGKFKMTLRRRILESANATHLTSLRERTNKIRRVQASREDHRNVAIEILSTVRVACIRCVQSHFCCCTQIFHARWRSTWECARSQCGRGCLQRACVALRLKRRGCASLRTQR